MMKRNSIFISVVALAAMCAYSADFTGLKPLRGTLTATGENTALSPLVYGFFFDDVNYAADGGLYGELLQNRDFEYTVGESRQSDWGPKYGWTVSGDKIDFNIATAEPVSASNPHYARLDVKNIIAAMLNNGGNALVNNGYDGIVVKKDHLLHFSVMARAPKNMNIDVALFNATNKKIGAGKLTVKASQEWKSFEVDIVPTEDSNDASLRIMPRTKGVIDLDMVSLFPADTFKGHKNGLRSDLAQALADMGPGFVCFPGASLMKDDAYDWKGSVGSPEARTPLFNPNGGHQTRGLGYVEFMEFCEDIGAEPLPMACADVQDALDLIQFANGDISTKWGAVRAAAGHSGKFNIKYIGVLDDDVRAFAAVADAVREAHPSVTVVPVHASGYRTRVLNNGTALDGALSMMNLVAKGGDVPVAPAMPLLANEKHASIGPALVSFNNNSVSYSADAEAMRVAGKGMGDRFLPSVLKIETDNADAASQIGAYMSKDSNTGEILLSIVNKLPVETTLDIDVRPFFPEGQGALTAMRDVMSGDPNSPQANVITDRVAVSSPFFTLPVPAGSFTVIRLKK